ncbi:redoxin domain-containing protein [Stieleria sp. ICT_E10.1]|uniref:TlpA family protein disulfide reductase n=1 Tax=Stieleria sedimenti TaxID=2976331 RepID=UPI002180510C|nr:redoxin domain-containing protein [Stieleria sedimenti]MCS7468289.1 redoxin domain-containing protein [Stieleria sedimenti]
MDKLIAEHESAHTELINAVRLAASNAEASGVAREAYSTQDFPRQFLDFAVAEDDEASLDSCRYLINKFHISKLRFDAIDHVTRYHFNKTGIDEFFMALVHHYALEPAADVCLKAGMKAPRTATRAHATYQLALLNLQRRDWCLDSLEERQNYVQSLGKDTIDHLLSDAGADEIADLLEKVITEYPDERYFDYSISKRAEQSLFTLRNLEVGCEAPAVVGKDSAGQELRLQDQKGNVVVVCFWAHWCGVCMESLPQETAFVSSMKDRPFVWLGVNGDDDIELLREAESSGKVNFHSWHDGKGGAIASRWNIWGFPSLFVIDQSGIIRYKSRGHVDLEIVFPIIEDLVTSVESERSKGITNR